MSSVKHTPDTMRIDWLIRDARGIPGMEKALMLIIATRGEECWASQHTIADDAGFGYSTIRRVLTSLVKKGLLVVDERPGFTSIYQISRAAVMSMLPGVQQVSTPVVDPARSEQGVSTVDLTLLAASRGVARSEQGDCSLRATKGKEKMKEKKNSAAPSTPSRALPPAAKPGSQQRGLEDFQQNNPSAWAVAEDWLPAALATSVEEFGLEKALTVLKGTERNWQNMAYYAPEDFTETILGDLAHGFHYNGPEGVQVMDTSDPAPSEPIADQPTHDEYGNALLVDDDDEQPTARGMSRGNLRSIERKWSYAVSA